jgi:NADPH:quinone reductase-like Zn-dependent oxidoreductase
MPTVLQFDRPGPTSELKFRDIPEPDPGPGEVRYDVLAFALNRGDLFLMADTYYNSPDLPSRIGQEAAGIVTAVGPDVTEFEVGDLVSSIVQEDNHYCVNGEFAVTPAAFLARWPAGFNAIEACAIWSAAITAYYPFVELARVTSDDAVLVTAGSSTVGTGAIQLARALGARVIATTRSASKAASLRQLGADHVIVTGDQAFHHELMEVTGGMGARVVFDPVAGDFIQHYVQGLAPHAQVYLVGALSGALDVRFPILPLVRSGASITGMSIYNYHRDPEMFGRAKSYLTGQFDSGAIRPVIDRTFGFRETVDAYDYMLQGRQLGKIVVEVDPRATRGT